MTGVELHDEDVEQHSAQNGARDVARAASGSDADDHVNDDGDEEDSADDLISFSSDSSFAGDRRRPVLELFHADDDAATVGRACFWFGTALALGTFTNFMLIIRDVINNSATGPPCLPHKAKRSSGVFARPGVYLDYFQGLGCLAFFSLCWAIVLYTCHACHIDYLAVLKKAPVVSTSKADALVGASKLVAIWSIFSILCSKVGACDAGLEFLVPVVQYVPGFMYFCTMVYVMYWTRATLPRLVAGALASPFTAAGVAPIDELVGNWLCSLTKPIVEVTCATCFYVTGEVAHESWGKCYDWTNGHGVNLGLFIISSALLRTCDNSTTLESGIHA
ncbi:unnamed protein product [Polarella glacialis]|uniref:EXS domain-containing protein n=1 Tax=Polarella glacialis TaxID=89957 RepID=A0A813JQK2_POLGL|nr:unnamed protein product [Polarella glacialis]